MTESDLAPGSHAGITYYWTWFKLEADPRQSSFAMDMMSPTSLSKLALWMLQKKVVAGTRWWHTPLGRASSVRHRLQLMQSRN